MKGEDVVITKRDRLKDVQFSLKDKHNRESTLITFFQENNECPTCEQHIDETFKSEKIKQNQTSVEKLEEGLNKMSDEMKKVEDKLKEYKKLSKSYTKK